ncbi:MAG: ABC transporter ATP-binding protein [Deltaproteobacteria bacterium]|nr:ABC transporter ATP-binding protein [Deltaproteobacteria bacterium]
MLKAIDLQKTYDTGAVKTPALRGVSLTIAAGDFVAVMGPSGCGKSTLMNILGCLDRPTAGRYQVDGRETAALGDRELSRLRNRKFGFIFQAFNLLPRYTCLENVMLPLVYRRDQPAGVRQRAADLLRQVGLGERLHARARELSGGQQQRVAIARALINDPEVIFADEPTGNLDSASSGEIMALITGLNRQGKTIVMVTHDPEVAKRAAAIIRMQDGRIIGRESC